MEAALCKVKRDFLNAFVKGKITYLVLLDLSAASETINHNILLNRIDTRFCIKGMDYLPKIT